MNAKYRIQDANIQTILEYSSDLDLPHYAQQFVASCQRVFLQANKETERKANNYLTFLQEPNEHGCF